MGMRVQVRAVRPDDIQRLEQAEVYSGLERGQTQSVHLEKAWHGLHFLLTGRAGESGVPLGFLLEGGQEVGETTATSRRVCFSQVKSNRLTPP